MTARPPALSTRCSPITATTDDNPLWDFALEFYQRPGVADALLVAQDELGADVMLLISAVYFAEQRRRVQSKIVDRWLDECSVPCGMIRQQRQLRRELAALRGNSLQYEAAKLFEQSLERWQADIIYGLPAPRRSLKKAPLVENLTAVLSLHLSEDAAQSVAQSLADFMAAE